ncbi:MAG: YeeE/YedE family protein [Chitinophagales bacterium]|nr:YeeE/YedE family protein [Chitinophagales bacterium]MDW8418527.1 YeeE/YedE thiosulfate transporter family protein [Chitinophagales bacterium]
MWSFIVNPWPWWFSGIVIVFVMFLLLYFGQSFGFSSNLRTICAMAGAGRISKFFDFDWKSQLWNIAFLVGAIIGGFIAKTWLSNGEPVKISDATIRTLAAYGFATPGGAQPDELFTWQAALTVKGFLVLALGGLLVGFGARYAGGCTSGHAISGLSNLQIPSLIAVIGFFAGGLLMTHVLFPLIFGIK